MRTHQTLVPNFGRGVPEEGWDRGQFERHANVLQGRPWAVFQAALGRTAFWDEGDGWSWIGFLLRSRGVSYLYVPYGPTVRDPEDLKDALASVGRAAKHLRLDFVRCEPIGASGDNLRDLSLLHAGTVLPARTLIVDLGRDEVEIRRDIHARHKNTINRAGRSGIELNVTSDTGAIEEAVRIIELTASDRKFRSHPEQYYRTMLETLMPLGAAKVGLATREGQVLSAAIVLDYGDTRAYAHAGNDPASRQIRSSAPLVWHLMLDAKSQGLTRWDFWGVAAPDAPPTDEWIGFSQFKRSFGGTDVEYAGAWELPVRPIRHTTFRLAKRAALSLRRS